MSSQINIKKSTSFSEPPTDKLGYGFDEYSNPCMINADGSKTILGTSSDLPPSKLANRGVGLDVDLPGSFTQGDIYVTTDTLLVYTAADVISWNSVALISSQFITDTSGSSPALYQYDGTDLTLLVNTNDKGWFATEAALNVAHPVGEDGWYANVGSTDTMWIWDGDTAAWVDSSIVPDDMAAQIVAASTKATPVDEDVLGYVDTEDSNALKKFTFTNLKAFLKTYFDTIYSTFSGAYADLTGKPDLTVYAVKTELLNSSSIASSATPSPVGSSRENELFITALAVNTVIAAPSGTPVNGNTLLIRIYGAASYTLGLNVIFNDLTGEIPASTVAGKEMYLAAVYNSRNTKWDIVGYQEEL